MLSFIQNGNLVVQDMYAYGFEEPELDEKQDKELLFVYQDKSSTSFIFRMPASNCHDPLYDAAILPDRYTFVMWAVGESDDGSMALTYHGPNKGSKSIPLLADEKLWREITTPVKLPADAQTLTLKIPEHEISTDTTSYMCMVIEPPNDRKYHMYKVAGLVNNDARDLVHHTAVYAVSTLDYEWEVGKVSRRTKRKSGSCGNNSSSSSSSRFHSHRTGGD